MSEDMDLVFPTMRTHESYEMPKDDWKPLARPAGSSLVRGTTRPECRGHILCLGRGLSLLDPTRLDPISLRAPVCTGVDPSLS